MKIKLLAGAMALSMGVVSNTSAITIEITSMVFGTTSAASGVADTDNLGTTFNGTFFGQAWTATTMAAFSTSGTWAGTSPQGAFSYNFTLGFHQVAFGTFFDWSVNYGIPVLAVFAFDGGGSVESPSLTGVAGYPMQVGPFPGQNPTFNGIVAPIPSAVWLFGSGLIGLVGLARRKKA